MGRSQPGVGLWSPHFFVLHFFESGLTLNLHNKRNSFGLFISLYLCCVVDCIKDHPVAANTWKNKTRQTSQGRPAFTSTDCLKDDVD